MLTGFIRRDSNPPSGIQHIEMDTKLTVDEIQLALYNSGIWNKRQDIFVPNLSWGLLNHEADLVILTKSGYLTEVEIKRSWEDFKADFKKEHEHKDEHVYRFYYCIPESIKDKVISFLEERYELICPSVLCYTEEGEIKITPGGWPNTGGRRLFIEEQLTVARLGCMRIWNLKEKLTTRLRA